MLTVNVVLDESCLALRVEPRVLVSPVVEVLRASGQYQVTQAPVGALVIIEAIPMSPAAMAVRVRLSAPARDGVWRPTLPANIAQAVMESATSLVSSEHKLPPARGGMTPEWMAIQAICAARNGDIAQMKEMGRWLVELGSESGGDRNMLTLGFECLSLAGAPLEHAALLLPVIRRASAEDAIGFRIRLGGLRTWAALGSKRLVADVVWLARQSAIVLADQRNLTPAMLQDVADVLVRLKRLGMPLPGGSADEIVPAVLNGEWAERAAFPTFGGSIQKLWTIARTMHDAHCRAADLDAAYASVAKLMDSPKSLLGLMCGDARTAASLAHAIQSFPEQVEPMFTDPTSRDARVRLRANDPSGAATRLRQALATDPTNCENRQLLATLFIQARLPAEAERVLAEAEPHRGAPGWPGAMAMWGGSAIDANQPDVGAARCTNALAVDPFQKDALIFRARARKRLGDENGARGDAATARLLYENDVERFLRASGV